ncbi:aldehyde reductase 2 [Aspergillus lentulus]|nr:aldehyde reductase 2 [Aspergillus lentulus]
MGSTAPTAVPSDGLVLVTGVNGFLASHLALNLGYKLRGTVQFQDKADWITEAVMKRYPDASFETVVVPNISVPGALRRRDPRRGWHRPCGQRPVLRFLRSATKELSVKRFVLTSSAITALTPQPEKEIHENKPAFVANTILPDFIVGPIIHAKQNGSTGRWVKEFFDDPVNYYKPLQTIIPRHFVDSTDVALLHTAGLTEEDVQSVQNERLLAFAGPFNFNNWLSVFRKIDPAKPWPEDDPNQVHDRSTVDTRRSKELLKRYSRPDFTSFVESVRDNCLNSDPEWKRSNFP